MIEQILIALSPLALTATGGAFVKLVGLDKRLALLESRAVDKDELLLVKLDSISEKIDLRCDALEGRVARIERSMNGHLIKD